MTNEERITHDIDLSWDFDRHLIDNPSEIEKLPDHFLLEFDENDQPVIIPSDKDFNPLAIPKKKSKKSFLKAACF
jgi:hypothetical protein